MQRMHTKEERQISKALGAFAQAMFECGEWTRDSKQTYDKVHNDAIKAENRLRKLIGMPPMHV